MRVNARGVEAQIYGLSPRPQYKYVGITLVDMTPLSMKFNDVRHMKFQVYATQRAYTKDGCPADH